MAHSKRRIGLALLLILVGIVFLLHEIFRWRFDLEDIFATIWPAALIIIGGYLIWRQWRRRDHIPGAQVYNKAFGDLDIGGGNVHADGLDAGLGFGDLRIDLTRVTFTDKEHRVYAHVGVGDIKILFPAGIPVRVRGNSGIGDVHLLDKTSGGLGSAITFESDDYQDAIRKVDLKVSTGIGDIVVTRAE